MTEDSQLGVLRVALRPGPHMRFALTVVYLVLLAFFFHKFSDTLWLAPAFAVSICALYFMPCVIAVALASYIVVSWLRFVYYMMSAVEADYWLEPYNFLVAVVMFTIVAVPSAALPFILKAVLRLTKRNLLGRNYGWSRFKADIALSLVLSIVVISIIYVGTHRKSEVTVSRLYHQTADLSLVELAARARDSSLSSEDRVAALIALSGYGLKVDQAGERIQQIQELRAELSETEVFEAFAAEFALETVKRSEFEEDDFPFWVRLSLKESLFFNAYSTCVRMQESGADAELATQQKLASHRLFTSPPPSVARAHG